MEAESEQKGITLPEPEVLPNKNTSLQSVNKFDDANPGDQEGTTSVTLPEKDTSLEPVNRVLARKFVPNTVYPADKLLEDKKVELCNKLNLLESQRLDLLRSQRLNLLKSQRQGILHKEDKWLAFKDLETSDGEDDEWPPKVGTATLAFFFKEGIMVAADHSYSSEEFGRNVIDLNSHILVTVSGEINDYGMFLRDLRHQYCCEFVKERGSVEEVSKWVAKTLSYHGRQGKVIRMLIAGWEKKGPKLYRLDSEGERLEGKLFSIGSGAPYAGGAVSGDFMSSPFMKGFIFDKEHGEMSFDEAADLAKRAMFLAFYEGRRTDCFLSVYSVGANGLKTTAIRNLNIIRKACVLWYNGDNSVDYLSMDHLEYLSD